MPLAAGFRDSELRRLTTCLARLVPNLRLNDVAITGGVAIQLGMAELGHAGSRDTIADLDMVASSLDAVSSSVAHAFLVSHYHVVQPGVPKFIVQLVDPSLGFEWTYFPISLTRSRALEWSSSGISRSGRSPSRTFFSTSCSRSRRRHLLTRSTRSMRMTPTRSASCCNVVSRRWITVPWPRTSMASRQTSPVGAAS